MSEMNPMNSRSAENLALHIKLANEAYAGHLDELECPGCRKPAVSVWFTNPAEDFYRTWFLCTACKFHTRAQNTEKPPFFSEGRRRADLEELDSDIIKKAIFKQPRDKDTRANCDEKTKLLQCRLNSQQ
jgi:hypothetical protein